MEPPDRRGPTAVPGNGCRRECTFMLPEMAPAPKAILSLKPKGMRQRAEQAWKSVFLLREAVHLWNSFLLFGSTGMRLSAKSEERIGVLFPALRDIAAVLEAFAVEMKLDGESEAKRQVFDEMFSIVRGPSKQLKKSEKAYYRGTGLQMLIQVFQRTILTQSQCLNAVGIKSAMFGGPPDAIAAELVARSRAWI